MNDLCELNVALIRRMCGSLIRLAYFSISFLHAINWYLYNQALADVWSTGAGIKCLKCISPSYNPRLWLLNMSQIKHGKRIPVCLLDRLFTDTTLPGNLHTQPIGCQRKNDAVFFAVDVTCHFYNISIK